MSASDLLGTKMLLATDGSEEAELATRVAVAMSERTDSELHVVYVEPLPEFMKNDDGTRGLGRIRRTLAGSVSESVFRHAHCPVMVVRVKGNSPNWRGGGRPRVRRVFSQDVGQASSALAPARSP